MKFYFLKPTRFSESYISKIFPYKNFGISLEREKKNNNLEFFNNFEFFFISNFLKFVHFKTQLSNWNNKNNSRSYSQENFYFLKKGQKSDWIFPDRPTMFYYKKKQILSDFLKKKIYKRKYTDFSIKNFRNFLFRYQSLGSFWAKKKDDKR